MGKKKTPAKQPPTLAELKDHYRTLFLDCAINKDKLGAVTQVVHRIVQNRKRYEAVVASLGTMPWWFIGLVHAMEADLSFKDHLHNGDPLTARTVHVPAGRPTGNPRADPKHGPSAANPYTWEESAEDVMRWKGLQAWTDWTIPAVLFKLEQYNGWGYEMYHQNVLTPYLWSFTNHYTKGKYAADGKWDANLVSAQAGAAAMLRLMVDTGVVIPTGLDPGPGDYEMPSGPNRNA